MRFTQNDEASCVDIFIRYMFGHLLTCACLMVAHTYTHAWNRFVDPSNGRAVAVNASVVRDAPSVFTAQPSAHLPMPSAVVHVHQREEVNNGWVPAEVEVGDWVTTRSRVQLCFVR